MSERPRPVAERDDQPRPPPPPPPPPRTPTQTMTDGGMGCSFLVALFLGVVMVALGVLLYRNGARVVAVRSTLFGLLSVASALISR